MTGEALNALREIGFRKTGRFHRQDGKLVLELEPAADDGPALYAFVLQGEVMYVGKTARKLKQRMYNYFNPGPTQPTNTRIRKLLGDALDFNDEVQIWGLIDDGLHRIGRFHLNLAAGLEDSIVHELAPPWNISGSRSPTKRAAAAENGMASAKHPRGRVKAGERPRGGVPPAGSTGLKPSFDLKLGRTYYNKGFFNVPVSCERYFGRHGKSIAIRCEGRPGVIRGRIDRQANPRTHAPRIFGGAALRDWIRSRFRQGERVRVVIEGPASLRMLKR